jgi:hypothetical protein
MTKMEDIGVYTIEMAKLDAWDLRHIATVRTVADEMFLTCT